MYLVDIPRRPALFRRETEEEWIWERGKVAAEMYGQLPLAWVAALYEMMQG